MQGQGSDPLYDPKNQRPLHVGEAGHEPARVCSPKLWVRCSLNSIHADASKFEPVAILIDLITISFGSAAIGWNKMFFVKILNRNILHGRVKWSNSGRDVVLHVNIPCYMVNSSLPVWTMLRAVMSCFRFHFSSWKMLAWSLSWNHRCWIHTMIHGTSSALNLLWVSIMWGVSGIRDSAVINLELSLVQWVDRKYFRKKTLDDLMSTTSYRMRFARTHPVRQCWGRRESPEVDHSD